MKNLTKKQERELSNTIQSGLKGLRKLTGVRGTPEQVLEAAKEYDTSKIIEARDRLIESVYPWALEYVNRHYGNHGSLMADDLRQAALYGLIKAALRFNATKAKFTTYATYWMCQSLLRTTHTEAFMIRIPEYQWQSDKIDKWKSKCSVAQVEIPEEVLVSEEIERVDTALILSEMESILNKREHFIISRRFGIGCSKETLLKVGEALSLSRERVRQIQNKALKKLKSSEVLLSEYKL